MCLTVPMKIEEISGLNARCTAMGQERWVNLTLLESVLPKIGDYIIVHLKFAQRVIPEHEALEAYKMFEEIIETLDKERDKERGV